MFFVRGQSLVPGENSMGNEAAYVRVFIFVGGVCV